MVQDPKGNHEKAITAYLFSKEAMVNPIRVGVMRPMRAASPIF